LVNSVWSFTVKHYDKDNSWTETNISDDSFPRFFTDTGDGKVNAARIRIFAKDGQYIQSGVNSKPQIKLNDRIRIIADDGASGTYNKVYDVIKITPIKSKSEGVMVEIELLGIERWLQKVNYSARIFAKTPKDIFSDLVTAYINQVSIASNTPTIQLSGSPPDISVNELPSAIKIQLDWGNNEDTIFNRMSELLDMLSSPQASGGVLDFFDMRFTYSTSSVTQFGIEIFSSGNASRSKPSVTLNSSDVNTEDTAGGFEEPKGLLISSWGASGAGSLPTNYSKFSSKQLIMPTSTGSQTLLPEWDSTFEYTVGAIVKYTTGSVDKVYKALRTTINDQPNISTSDWSEITINDYYKEDGTNITYSPWTAGQQVAWETCMANPNAGTSQRYMWDANIIINDDRATRVWADIVALTPSTITTSKSQWLYGGTTFYDGLRVFVKGTGTGDFSGFSNTIIEYNDETEGWVIKYTLKQNMLISVLEDATVWKYDGGGSYTSFSSVHNGLDCFHPIYSATSHLSSDRSSIQNRETLSGGLPTDFPNNPNSALTATFRWTPVENWTQEWDDIIVSGLTGIVGIIYNAVTRFAWPTTGGTITTPRNTTSWYSAGAWLCLRFPFPKNRFGLGVGEDIGYWYGGSTSTNIVPQLDFQNMTYSHDGKRGFNQGSSSEDLGPISSIDFNMKIIYVANLIAGGQDLLSKEDFKMRCFLIDKNDNVVYQDFVVLFNNHWEPISLPLDGFKIYKGRKPIYEDGFFEDLIIPPKEMPSVNQFEWRHVAMMCIQTTDSYDEAGRYRAASANSLGTGHYVWDSQAQSSLEMTIEIDALRFAKPLLTNSGQVNDLNNEPEFVQSPDIFLYDTLKNNTLAELEKQKFKNKSYDVKTEGQFNIGFGDYFVLADSDIVDETYTDSGGTTYQNQIKLVAKHIEYEFSKPNGLGGGFSRRILGAKRFE
jgi:hypothetical protein